jgi:hypothetical protein
MRQELTEEGPPGSDPGFRAVVAAVADAAGGAKRVQQLLVAEQTGQLIE